ncbi:histidine kinase [Malaciobacter molluscorum LMG 25693]|uniref:histidine kinase n=1 Tax=Malaciobacter molluscorum LMG 25693 TaxID=870501 RepID=A0A2G1DJZ3_9BACT|nr:sensor histidine kinase [Malaciobacter molluscorum]AXX91409.1 7TMR-DISM-7TM domain-containing two-component system sensor histidine kinase [Malaciobacter molluscorum LMG 25693]PHO18843.1 histidine kinase [Malaciobacter molluscorum LMG 25693]
MIRIFLLTILILLSLNAKDLLIKNRYISKDNKVFIQLKDFDLENEILKNAIIKISLDKDILEKRIFFLKIICDVTTIKNINIKYKQFSDFIIIKVDKTSPKDILITFNYQKKQTLKFALLRYNKFEYKYIEKKENLLYGIAYGIIFCAFLYNLAIFLYTKQKSFLYYSLMQFCLIVILYYAVTLAEQSFVSQTQQMIADFFETTCILMMILFSKEILNIKKYFKYIDKFLNILIYLSLIDLIIILIYGYSQLYNYIPRSIIVFTLVFAGLVSIFKGQKVAIFYFFGWFVVFICLVMMEHDIFYLNNLYIIHVGLPLESVILSFALAYKLKLSSDEKKQKENMLIQQSKLASMGEMLNNIAHQWRQPLANLSFINMDLKMAIKSNDINIKYLNEVANDSKKQINFMSETLDNFKGFYQPNRKKENFFISETIYSCVNIIENSLNQENIKVDILIIKDKEITAYKNELIQVILNLITNSKDIIIQRKIISPKIIIKLDIDENNNAILEIKDNAGGINKQIINKIFEPYFTTKNNGSGIGLYMSKVIIQSHIKGQITVKNSSKGACFRIVI